ncbi:hypothetical protein AUP68_09886 [Ilyonectria robusta]
MALSSFAHGGLVRRAARDYSAEDVLVIVSLTVALYNAFELLSLIFMTFKRRHGLYFWAIFLASFAILPYCMGRLIVYFDLTHKSLGITIECIGWVFLVSGQSVVLYSRLHLVLNDHTILRAVLMMIIFNAVVWHPTTIILTYGSYFSPQPSRGNFASGYNIVERVQMTCFCLQEFILSGLYIWKTLDILRTSLGNKRKIMWHLFVINIIIVMMDIGLLVLEYMGHFHWQQAVKVAFYSVKLKLEFAVLGELVDFVQHRGTNTALNTSGFVELSSTRTQTGDKRQSTARPDAMHVEDTKPTAVAAGADPNATSQTSEEDAAVEARRHPRNDSFDQGEDQSTNQMYDIAIQQISRSK